jgi:hypothetical protein
MRDSEARRVTSSLIHRFLRELSEMTLKEGPWNASSHA